MMPAKEEYNKATFQEPPFKLRKYDAFFIQNQQRKNLKKNILLVMLIKFL